MRRLTLSAVLLLVLGCLGGAPGASAARARTFDVTAQWASSEVYTGDAAVLTGKVSPVRRTKKVLVQLKQDSGWVTVAQRSLTRRGKWRWSVTPSEVGSYDYRAKMPRVGEIRGGTSPVRTLTVTLNPVVTFTIPPNSTGVPWNSQDAPVVAQVGQTLHLVNGDTEEHLLHSGTEGYGPFPHPNTSAPIPPGGSADYVITWAFAGSIYCHLHNTNEKFWITTTDPSAG